MESKKKINKKKHLRKVLFRRKLFSKLAEEATTCVENLFHIQYKYLHLFSSINTILQQII